MHCRSIMSTGCSWRCTARCLSGATIRGQQVFDADADSRRPAYSTRSDGCSDFLHPPCRPAGLMRRPARICGSSSGDRRPRWRDARAIRGQFGRRILERYGMTETGSHHLDPYEGDRLPGTVGHPLPAWKRASEAKCLREFRVTPMCSRAIGAIPRRPPRTSAPTDGSSPAMSRPWRRTAVSRSSGRAKDLIITGGFNVYPREIEHVIDAIPGVAKAP